MAQFARFTLAAALLGLASAQSQSALVTQIYFPLADAQPLDASIIDQSPGATTILMNCAPDTPSDECGFPSPITLTVGPSTLHYVPSGIYQILGDIDCKITASATADCTVAAGLYTNAADESGTATGDAYITTPAASSSTTSDIVSGTDVSWLDITITAGLEKGVTGATATSTATSTSGGKSGVNGSSSGSGTGSGAGTSASRTGPSSSATASATGNVAAGSSKVGYTGLGVAAVLVAGSMMML